MRMLATTTLIAFGLVSAGCDVILQPAQQGEWSNSTWGNPKHQVTKDAREAGEGQTPGAEKAPAESK